MVMGFSVSIPTLLAKLLLCSCYCCCCWDFATGTGNANVSRRSCHSNAACSFAPKCGCNCSMMDYDGPDIDLQMGVQDMSACCTLCWKSTRCTVWSYGAFSIRSRCVQATFTAVRVHLAYVQ
jgi:hypothetical protein